MYELIDEIEKTSIDIKEEAKLLNPKMNTIIKCCSNLYCTELKNFVQSFNFLFTKESANNSIEIIINDNVFLFEKAMNIINLECFTETAAIKKFNTATITTSFAKCTIDKMIYIIKCYDYFIYIFNKKTIVNKQQSF